MGAGLSFVFNNGTSAIGYVSLPYAGTGLAVTIDWGDGTTDNSLTHTYTLVNATAKVSLTGGTITQFGSYNWAGVQLLTRLTNTAGDDNWGWGTGAINMSYAFYNAYNLTSVPSTIPVGVNNISYMFCNTSVFNSDISSWNVSNVTDMSLIFSGAIAFNSDISSWIVSNVTDMNNMFYEATVFNQILNSWNVSNVTDMVGMFAMALSFDTDISIWNVSNVTDMGYMFNNATVFNQNIRSWNTTSVTSYSNMFGAATMMIATYTGVTGFGTTPTSDFFNYNPYSLDFTFDNGASAIGYVALPYGGTGLAVRVDWGDGTTDNSLNHTYIATNAIAKVEVTSGTITQFGSSDWLGIRLLRSLANNTGDDNWGWGTGAINMNYAFSGATNLTSVPSTIPVGVNNMTMMFGNASVFNSDISSWNVSNVTDMNNMFLYALVFNSDISNWNVSNVTNMSAMFVSTYVFNSDISSWIVSNVVDMTYMFDGATVFNQILNSWNVSNVISMNSMFSDASSFNSDISSWNVSNVIDMNSMFANIVVFNQDISNWNVSNVADMAGMFVSAYAFNSDISNWNVSNVTDMNSMFSGSVYFNADISSWNVSNVTDMRYMFSYARSFDQNIRSWNVSNVNNMTQMFNGAELLNQDVRYWKPNNVTSFNNMFNSATEMIAQYNPIEPLGYTPRNGFGITPTIDFFNDDWNLIKVTSGNPYISLYTGRFYTQAPNL